MPTQSPHEQELNVALEMFIQTTTREAGFNILQQHPELLEDNADLLLSSLIDSARKQGHETTAQALDERRDFIRSVRQELLDK